jgi:hypothetical protein
MNRKTKSLFGAIFTAIAALILLACMANNQDKVVMDMNEEIMMHYGWYSHATYFDASRWFKNGMYQRDTDSFLPSGYSDVRMIRVSPLTFKDSDLINVRIWLVLGLDPRTDNTELERVPNDYEEILMDSRFDPRQQIHYSGSYFKEPDFPVDVYGCYLLIKGKHFIVSLERDGRTGKFIRADRDIGIVGISYDEQQKLFKELEEKQKQEQEPQKSSSPPSDPSPEPISHILKGGNKCPRTGWWYTHIDGGKTRFFSEGEIFPEFPSNTTYWQWERDPGYEPRAQS